MSNPAAFTAGLPTPKSHLNAIDFIKGSIECEKEGKLSLAGYLRLIDAIDDFEDEFGYLPLEFEKWRDEQIKEMRQQIENL